MILVLLTCVLHNNKDIETEDGYYLSESGSDVYILLHGIPGNYRTYTSLINELERQGKKVLAPHLNKNTLSGDTEYISNLIEMFEITDATLVVHDRGGLVGVPLLETHPQIISNTIILNTILEPLDAPFPQNKFGELIVSILYSNTFIGDFITKATLKQGGLTNEKINDFIPKNKQPVRSFFTSFNQATTVAVRNKKILDSYDGSVKIIWGEHDPFLPKELHTKNLDDVYILSGGEHFIQYTHPNEIAEIILQDN